MAVLGLRVRHWESYIPSLGEISITLGITAGALFVFGWLAVIYSIHEELPPPQTSPHLQRSQPAHGAARKESPKGTMERPPRFPAYRIVVMLVVLVNLILTIALITQVRELQQRLAGLPPDVASQRDVAMLRPLRVRELLQQNCVGVGYPPAPWRDRGRWSRRNSSAPSSACKTIRAPISRLASSSASPRPSWWCVARAAMARRRLT